MAFFNSYVNLPEGISQWLRIISISQLVTKVPEWVLPRALAITNIDLETQPVEPAKFIWVSLPHFRFFCKPEMPKNLVMLMQKLAAPLASHAESDTQRRTHRNDMT